MDKTRQKIAVAEEDVGRKGCVLMFAFSNDFGSLKALAIPPRPKGDQRSDDCDQIVGDGHRS
jgi:hypothetical protein